MLACVETMINTRLTEQEIINQMHSVNVDTILHTIPLELDNFNLYDIDAINKLKAQNIESSQFNMNDIASIMFTSGTTGPQKAVPQTFHNHFKCDRMQTKFRL